MFLALNILSGGFLFNPTLAIQPSRVTCEAMTLQSLSWTATTSETTASNIAKKLVLLQQCGIYSKKHQPAEYTTLNA